MESLAFPTIDPAPPPAFVTVTATQDIDPLIRAARDAFQNAMSLRAALDETTLGMDGHAGKKLRMIMNNLMSELDDPRLLAIGLHHGACFCPAIYLNQLRAVGIDDWSGDDSRREVFDANLVHVDSELARIEIINGPYRAVDYGAIGTFNVFHYDGPDVDEDHYGAMLLAQPALDDRFILIVSNWNMDPARAATFHALRDAGNMIDFSIEIRTSFDGTNPKVLGRRSEWHNGVLIAVVSKA